MSDFLGKYPLQAGPFQPTFESLRTYQCPQWFRDAKLGIWSHWGPQSVPMYGDWYARHMYWEGHVQYLHHWRNYGHPSKHGYKDIVKLWKAEKFDPDALMELYIAAGAQYFVAQGVHHDNFDNWDSKHNPWNATKVGPMMNIVGLWEKAARKRGLKFGISEHLAASLTWFMTNKSADATGPYAGISYDGQDPANHSLYYAHHGKADGNLANNWKIDPWYNEDPGFQEMWFNRIKDLVDQHEPDLLYSDGGLPWERVGLSLVSHMYNLSARKHGANQAVYLQKDTRPEIHSIGVLDIERGNSNEPAPFPWQNDTCVGGWYYDIRQVYKPPRQVIEIFVDCVAKNGNLLLNLTQKPDGSFDEECLYILKSMASWIRVNGEGIYGTRPWTQALEGPSRIVSGHHKEDAVHWTTADFRFTSKARDGRVAEVFAFQMKYPQHGQAFIRALGLSSGHEVIDAAVLGSSARTPWHQHEDGLLVHFPATKVCDFVPCIKVTLG